MRSFTKKMVTNYCIFLRKGQLNMLEVDINFLEHLYMLMKAMMDMSSGKITDPEKRQEIMNVVGKTQRQFGTLIQQAREEYALKLIREQYEGGED